MTVQEVQFQSGQEILSGRYFKVDPESKTDLIFLHGAGKSTKDKASRLAHHLCEHGITVFTFDFSGHGLSSGRLQDSSLKKRLGEARAAFDLVFGEGTGNICAFSMGGQVALEIILEKKVKNLFLFYPAIYAEEAFELEFGSAFSEVIRKAESWRYSRTLKTLDLFKGTLTIFHGLEDTVVPIEVINAIEAAARNVAKKEIVLFKGVGHNLLDEIQGDARALDTTSERIVHLLRLEQTALSISTSGRI